MVIGVFSFNTPTTIRPDTLARNLAQRDFESGWKITAPTSRPASSSGLFAPVTPHDDLLRFLAAQQPLVDHAGES